MALAKGGTVNWFMWGGSDSINAYVSEWVGGVLRDEYDITLNRVGISDTVEAVNIVLGEKEAGVLDNGSVDMIWINGENFKTVMQADMAFCGYFETLPNNRLIDWENPSVANDFGLPVNGCEAPWTRGKGFIYAYDPGVTPNPPRSIPELIEWVKENPSAFTYTAPPDFQGSAFVRHVFYHAAGGVENLMGDFDQAKFDEVAEKAWKILNDMEPYLWREGKTYPTSQAALDNLLANQEIVLYPNYDAENVARAIADGKFPDSMRTYMMKDGGIANTSYTLIPFNSPNKAAAMVLQNVLLSGEAHYQKALPEVWGSNPGIEMDRTSEEIQAKFNAIERHPSMDSEVDPDGVGTLPELPGAWTTAIEKGWLEHVGK
ncbi:ABC transporter substrate-binding protein [uncultured Tateyamaria sp.]|uniref:ABC transporter substrate-binding protein n=1 Tax=uncultured Tateyamaria sp. TaxID=455651 RepID=UPI00262A3A59|nr:ABC transporter substrate-binding protein [uncultured Tateyamaria sp.]